MNTIASAAILLGAEPHTKEQKFAELLAQEERTASCDSYQKWIWRHY